MSELVLVIRKPLDDDDMQGWCEMLFDSPFLRGLTPDQLTELMLTLASEVGTFDLLEDLADTYVAIEHSTPVPTAQEMYRYLVDEVNVQRAFDTRLTYPAALAIAMHKAIDKFGLSIRQGE